MPDRERLARRYPDLLTSDAGDALRQVVADFDAAALPYHRLDVPPALDRLADQLSQQRPQTATAGAATPAVPDRSADDAGTERRAEPVPLGASRTRRWWVRQGLGMVAAVLVLVLVGGTLALVLHGRGSQGGATLGSGAATSSGATTAPHLPLTVTAAGIPITLESVDASGSGTRLTFTVRLPSDLVSVGASEVVVLFPADLEAEGITIDQRELGMEGEGHPPGQPTTTFSMDLDPILHPQQGATLTLRQIRLTPAPGSMRAVPGPWTFRITPAMLDAQAQPLPKPNRFGEYTNLSLAQAQRLVAFPIVEPQPLPAVLQSVGNSLMAVAAGPTGSAKANVITLIYQARDMTEKGVTVEESTNGAIIPTDKSGKLQFLGLDGKTVTIKSSASSRRILSIQGVPVSILVTTEQGTQVSYYTWQRSGVSYLAYTILGSQVTDAVMQRFIAAMIAPAGPNATPTDQPTPLPAGFPTPNASGQYENLTFTQAQQLAPFHLAQPTWVPSSLQGHQVTATAPPGAEVEEVILSYGSAPDSWRNVQIHEHGGRVANSFPGNPVPVTLTIAGHIVSRVVYTTNTGTYTDFEWKDQGTTFTLTSQLTGPLTEQDVEHMIASMFVPARAAATPAALVPSVPGAAATGAMTASRSSPKSAASGRSGEVVTALWWVLWIIMGVGCIALMVWLANRLDGGNGPGDDGSVSQHLNEVDIRSRLIP